MKRIKLLVLVLLVASCQKVEEETLDLDQMALSEEEMAAKHLAGEPMNSPQEILIKESASIDGIENSL